jgi:hypothetical protein
MSLGDLYPEEDEPPRCFCLTVISDWWLVCKKKKRKTKENAGKVCQAMVS